LLTLVNTKLAVHCLFMFSALTNVNKTDKVLVNVEISINQD